MKQKKNRHKQKVKAARKLIGGKVGHTFSNIIIGGRAASIKFSKFTNKKWEDSKAAIKNRVKRKQQAAHDRAVARKAAKTS